MPYGETVLFIGSDQGTSDFLFIVAAIGILSFYLKKITEDEISRFEDLNQQLNKRVSDAKKLNHVLVDQGNALTQAQQHYTSARKGLDDLAVGTPGKGLIHPQQIAKAINDHAATDAVFTCDVGLPTVWAARYLAMNGSRRLIGSFWHGSMANALAQGIGAQAAFPGRQVVSLSGDGGFTMLMGDFLSLVQLGLQVKVVVFNNGALGFIELEQKSTGFLPFGTEFKNPNFATMAEAIGVRGIRLEDPAEVDAGIAAALTHNGPVLVDAVVNRTELAMPPSITMEMAKGFTLYMVKAVMSGRADEVLDLAVTNLWR